MKYRITLLTLYPRNEMGQVKTIDSNSLRKFCADNGINYMAFMQQQHRASAGGKQFFIRKIGEQHSAVYVDLI